MAAAPVTPTRAVMLMRQMMLGLRHAHGHGIVHRDLKPDNIMITELGGVGEVVKILDFGFAHINDSRHSQSNANLVPGTPSYMSPEQAQGLKTDLRTDLYSASVILYELCVGFKPFVSGDTAELLQKHIHEPPIAPRQAAPAQRISEALEQVDPARAAKEPRRPLPRRRGAAERARGDARGTGRAARRRAATSGAALRAGHRRPRLRDRRRHRGAQSARTLIG